MKHIQKSVIQQSLKDGDINMLFITIIIIIIVIIMHCFLFKFTLVLYSVLLFWKLLVFEFLPGIAETLLCSMSTPHVRTAPLQDAYQLLIMLFVGTLTYFNPKIYP
jgi:hypothetical protein